MKKALPLVSVVVTTKNEEKHIAGCLESIKRQAYPGSKIETIVVDNNSTDKTKEIAKKYMDKVFNFGPERSAQRNFGLLKKAKGKHLMYLDADMRLSKEVIEKAVKKIEGSNLIALYIPEVVLGDSFFSQVRRFERSFYDGTVIDAVRFVKAEIFKKVGGFDTLLTGPEDWDLDKKIRNEGAVEVLKGAVLYHDEEEFDFRKYLNKKVYYAKSMNVYIKKWGKDDPDIKKQFSFWYRYFGVFYEKGKWKKIVRHPILTIGMYFLKILVGAFYLWQKAF